MAYQDIEESRLYRLAEEIAEEVWDIVRGSIKETRWHLRRAVKRHLLNQAQFDGWVVKLEQAAKNLNGYVAFQKTRVLKDEGVEYTHEFTPGEYLDDPTN
ncbi:MAG TPA: hypothetical protein VJG32_21130 [Anaerolineae bacterium]|nr:hypothetical protein [Anaerolineae bacterium]